MRRIAAIAVVSLLASVSSADRASADLLLSIDKSSQRMTVLVNGAPRHTWLVSTGTGGGPPSGIYRPQRMERKWYSRKFNWSPMPHAIFFHKGYAIHGTGYVSRLGRPASHGCVRLHPSHAAVLFALVRSQGVGRTTIVVSNSARYADRR
jgi:lipoprotein-anchoring transpeptidase ErfK/SrfK